MQAVQENIEEIRIKRSRLEDENSELYRSNEALRKNLSEKDIKMIFKANLAYFKQIKSGLETSWRHKLFRNPKNKTKNETVLRQKMIAFPFSDLQQDLIYKEVKNTWLKDTKQQLKNNQYVEMVLLPEVFIKIYQRYFHLESTTIAEKRIFQRGSCDPADLTPETDSIFV